MIRVALDLGRPAVVTGHDDAERVTAAVLIGETAEELATAFAAAGLERIERAGSMGDAVARAGTPTALAARQPARLASTYS